MVECQRIGQVVEGVHRGCRGIVAALRLPVGVADEHDADGVAPRVAPRIRVDAQQSGQPDAETLSRLAARNIPVWRTDRDGGVRLVLDGRSTATPWRPIPR